MPNRRPKFQKQRPPDPSNVDVGWRLFIAIPMPPPARALIESLTESLAARDWPVRWVAGESAHLTLHFLGETPPERAELLRLALAPVVARHQPFTLQTGELGVFPNDRQPRVLWLGLRRDVDALAELHRAIGRELSRQGFEVEPRSFRPHITLGRVREEAPRRLADEIRAAYGEPAVQTLVGDAANIPVHDVVLMRSFLERGGARHVSLASYPLGPRGT